MARPPERIVAEEKWSPGALGQVEWGAAGLDPARRWLTLITSEV
jgi:hypothetical protein